MFNKNKLTIKIIKTYLKNKLLTFILNKICFNGDKNR